MLKYCESKGINGDYDSDSILLTDNQMFIDAARKNYDKFKVPTCFVSAKKIKRYYTDEQKADLDVKTSVNKIGEDINLSQQLNSLFWQHIHDGQSFEDNDELYRDICKLAVLSNIEIDKAKKEYAVDVGKEINSIKEKYKIVKEIKSKDKSTNIKKVVKPMFFKMITQENGYELNERHLYEYFDTPMDYLQKRLSSYKFREGRSQRSECLPFSSIVKEITVPEGATYYFKQRDRIIDIVRNTNNSLRELYIDYDSKTKDEKNEIKIQAAEIKQECVEYINDMSVSEITMSLLLKSLDQKNFRDVKRRIFLSLFGTPNKTFFAMIQDNKGSVNQIVENTDGSIDLYGYKFQIK